MRKYLKTIISIFILGNIILPFTSQSQGFLKVEGKSIINANGEEVILRGMGLGGWMLHEGYMMQTSGFANTQNELKEKITELIDKVKSVFDKD